MKTSLLIAALASLAAAPALAQSGQHDTHSQHNMGGMQHMQMPQTPYTEAEMNMHERMMRAGGSAADEMWVRKMIEHHRGAIAMSDILLARGGDREALAMARRSSAQQRREIGQLQRWLRSHRRPAQ